MNFYLFPLTLGSLRVQANSSAGNKVVVGQDAEDRLVLIGGGHIAVRCYLNNEAISALHVGVVNFDTDRLPTVAEMALIFTR